MVFNFFSQSDNRIPNLNASIRAQHRHEPKVKAMRVNGQITEVKQSMSRGSTGMGDHLFFFSLAMIGRNIKQIRKVAKFY